MNLGGVYGVFFQGYVFSKNARDTVSAKSIYPRPVKCKCNQWLTSKCQFGGGGVGGESLRTKKHQKNAFNHACNKMSVAPILEMALYFSSDGRT